MTDTRLALPHLVGTRQAAAELTRSLPPAADVVIDARDVLFAAQGWCDELVKRTAHESDRRLTVIGAPERMRTLLAESAMRRGVTHLVDFEEPA